LAGLGEALSGNNIDEEIKRQDVFKKIFKKKIPATCLPASRLQQEGHMI